MLTDEQIKDNSWRLSAERAYEAWTGQEYLVVDGINDFARAIEAAACAERDKRIAELERQLHEQAVSLEEARKDAEQWKKQAEKLESAHESTVSIYSLPKGQS